MDSVKRFLFCGVAFAALASAQNVIEDFKCQTPTGITNASPAVMSFAEDCGFNLRASIFITMAAAGNDGDTLTFGSATFTLRTEINNVVANESADLRHSGHGSDIE